jgi:hypothetical protein
LRDPQRGEDALGDPGTPIVLRDIGLDRHPITPAWIPCAAMLTPLPSLMNLIGGTRWP